MRRPVRIAVAGGAIAIGVIVLLWILYFTGTEDPGPTRDDELKKRMDELRSVPYTSRTSSISDTTQAGVIFHDPARTYPGYTLYCSRTTPYANLIDMNGKIVHSWTYPTKEPAIWEHAVMLENGDLLAILKMKTNCVFSWIPL